MLQNMSRTGRAGRPASEPNHVRNMAAVVQCCDKQAQLPSWVTDRGGELYSRELQTVLDLIVERREKLS